MNISEIREKIMSGKEIASKKINEEWVQVLETISESPIAKRDYPMLQSFVLKHKDIPVCQTLANALLRKIQTITIPMEDEYPLLDEIDFQSKLTKFKEFHIKSKTHHADTPEELETLADQLCNAEMELSTYQTVVRNFLSNETPYNGLLLFHGLGTGKTCSAITIAEQHRLFLKQSGMQKYIYVLGNPNIQSNFKKQLFHESQLIQKGDVWTCKSCVGNALLREINAGKESKEEIISRMETLIHKHYRFMGYRKFAIDATLRKKQKQLDEYQHCMIIIDEVQNVKENENSDISPSKALDFITKKTTVKLLLLSATPMFNDPGEIIWLMNLLNRNDKRYEVKESDMFTSDGDIIDSEIPRFLHHIRGYVSFVKGENPFTFPYRIYPSYFSSMDKKPRQPFAITFDNDSTMQDLKTQVYPVELSAHQKTAYKSVVGSASSSKTLSMSDSFPLLNVLNMSYPQGVKLDYMKKREDIYDYAPGTIRCFDPEHIQTYSAKIHAICNHIKTSTGIVLIYSQFVEEGVLPMALALESMGFRNANQNLLKQTMHKSSFTYCMLTGRQQLSPNSEEMIRRLNSTKNKNGEDIKVVLITRAASEGIDLKNIRQIHIMDPWWNLNRNEQIIGRGIRLCSHKALPFEQRNAQIFLYVSYIGEMETVDHYIYRFAEKKAKKIGKITRLLKENAMDCIMNNQVTDMSHLTVPQLLSNGDRIEYSLKESSMSVLCDFMDCNYTCNYTEQDATIDSKVQMSRTMEQIRNLFQNGYVYEKKELYDALQLFSPISYTQLHEALSQMIDLKMECRDMVHRKGYIVNFGTYYMFQPENLPETIPVYERRIPVNKTKHSIIIEPHTFEKRTNVKTILEEFEKNIDLSTKKGTDWYGLSFYARTNIEKVAKKHKFYTDQFNDIFDQIIIDHMIELLVFSECQPLLHYLVSKERTPLEEKIFSYFKIDKYKKGEKIRVWNNTVTVTLFRTDGEWSEIEIHEEHEPFAFERYGTVVGGITNKGEDTRVFKSKFMDKSVISYGQVCEGAGLTTVLRPRIQNVLGDDYSESTAKEICCELELLLRFLDKIKYNTKRWFLSSVEVIDNNKDEIINLIKKLKS
jgi:hypothetical protein